MSDLIETIGMGIIAIGIFKIMYDYHKEIEAHEETKVLLKAMTAAANMRRSLAAMPEVKRQAQAILDKQYKRKTPIKKKKK